MRFQAELDKKDAAVLLSLKKDMGARSNADLLAEVLTLLNLLVSERRRGRKVAMVDDAGRVQLLVSPALERVAPGSELPHVEITWTQKELKSLAALANRRPTPPTARLIRALKRA